MRVRGASGARRLDAGGGRRGPEEPVNPRPGEYVKAAVSVVAILVFVVVCASCLYQ